MGRRAIVVPFAAVAALVAFAAVQTCRPRDSDPRPETIERRADPPPLAVLQAAPLEPTPAPAPVPDAASTSPAPDTVLALPAEPEPATFETVAMPGVTGIAVFDDGRPVADATIRVTAVGERMILAVASTDGDGRFACEVPGYGPADYWFDDHGFGFAVQAPLRDSTAIVVPTFSLRVRIAPATEPAIVALASPNGTPGAFWLDGVEKPPAPTLAYAAAVDQRFGARRVSVTGSVDLRLPVVAKLVLWASSADGERTSNVVELTQPTTARDPIVLTLSPAVSMAATLTVEGASADRSIDVATFGPSVPARVHVLARSGGVLRGLIPGQRYQLRSESKDVHVVHPREFVAEAGRTIDVRAERLTTTRVEVVDGSGAPLRGAGVRISVPLEDPASKMGPASLVGGFTDENGVWEGHSAPWEHARAVVFPPAGNAADIWEGEVRAGGTYEVILDGEPFTTLRVHPPDCVVLVVRKSGEAWRLPGTQPISVPADALVEVTSGGRYVRQRVRARELPAPAAEIRLEKAARFEVVTPPETASLRFFQGGGLMFIDEAFVVRSGPGRFEVTGLASGASVGVVGRCGTPARPCTDRVDFPVREGETIVLEPKAVGANARSRKPPK
jgi:hypothetical protein